MSIVAPSCLCDHPFGLDVLGPCPVHGTPRTRDALRRARVRAECAEAALEQAREALERIEALGDRNFLDPAEEKRPARIARDALARLDKEGAGGE